MNIKKTIASVLCSALMLNVLGGVPPILGTKAVEIIESEDHGTAYSWEIDSEGTLTINGTGVVDNGVSDYAKQSGRRDGGWKNRNRIIKKVIIDERITGILPDAFYGCKMLESIVVPDSVTFIGAGAFGGCSSLESIDIPDSVTYIGDGAFAGCSSLSSITIPESVNSFGELPFRGTPWLEKKQEESPLVIVNGILIDATACTGDVVIPNTVTYINDCAFFFNEAISSVGVPETVNSIGEWAFKLCKNLRTISIPKSVISIGESAFDETPWLNSQKKSSPLVVVNGILIDASTCSGDVIIPNTVIGINDSAFFNCYYLTSVIIPESVTYIGNSAFWGCINLETLTIPDSVTYIGDSAFYKCSNLTSVDISNSITKINDRTFVLCENLESITLPEGITSIGENAFVNCDSLLSISIPDSVTQIGRFAFSSCDNLTFINLPESVTKIGQAFSADTPWLNKQIENNEFVVTNGILICLGTCREKAVIPDSVTTIGEFALASNNGINTYLIPEFVSRIDEGAFYNKYGTTRITIKNPDCDIYDNSSTFCSGGGGPYYNHFDGVLIGYDGSTTQKYAEKYGYNFESLGEAPNNFVLGDPTEDGKIDAKDATFILGEYAKLSTGGTSNLSDRIKKAADVNNDEKIDSKDASAVLAYYAYLSTTSGDIITLAEFMSSNQ